MKPIETDVLRPTAKSIVRFFYLSGKRHLLLTGSRSRGKTTLLKEILPLLQEAPVPGITTAVERERGVWLRENISGETAVIGLFDPDSSGSENRMRPVDAGFLSLGISALNRGLAHASTWFSVDEIGYLECGCAPYCNALRSLMSHKSLIAVIRKQELAFLRELTLRPDVCVVDLDRPFRDIGCVIMASGLGTRFGGNKLMADFSGKPLIAWILDATEGLFAHRVVVTRHKDVETLCRSRHVDTVLHSLPHRSDTVRLGVDAIGADCSGYLFCPADQPLLTRESLQTILLAAAHAPDRILQLSCDGIPCSPVLFPRDLLDELRKLPEGAGGKALSKRYPERLMLIPAAAASEGMDADTPEDLAQLSHLFHPI